MTGVVAETVLTSVEAKGGTRWLGFCLFLKIGLGCIGLEFLLFGPCFVGFCN